MTESPGGQTTFSWDGETVSGFWHHPLKGSTHVVLGHGAGGTMETPTLVRFAEVLADRGVGAVRFNFPYAEARRRVPDPQPRLEAATLHFVVGGNHGFTVRDRAPDEVTAELVGVTLDWIARVG